MYGVLTGLNKGAFGGCTALTEINFNATTMEDLSYNGYIFHGAGKNGNGITVNISANVTKIPAYLFYPYYSSSIDYSPKITSVVFAENSVCESIGSYAFYNCSDLTSITIPESITSIGNYAFYGCTKLTKINFNATAMEDLNNANRIFYNAGTKGDGVTVNIGANVTKIPTYLFYAFDDYPKITSVIFVENSVCESIGSYAFYGCKDLTDIIYNGYKAVWEAITKGYQWDYSMDSYTIHCTDGTISK